MHKKEKRQLDEARVYLNLLQFMGQNREDRKIWDTLNEEQKASVRKIQPRFKNWE